MRGVWCGHSDEGRSGERDDSGLWGVEVEGGISEGLRRKTNVDTGCGMLSMVRGVEQRAQC